MAVVSGGMTCAGTLNYLAIGLALPICTVKSALVTTCIPIQGPLGRVPILALPCILRGCGG